VICGCANTNAKMVIRNKVLFLFVILIYLELLASFDLVHQYFLCQ